MSAGGVALSVEGGDDLTHEDWAARSDAVAAGVEARGAEAIGLIFDPAYWADFAVAWLGVLKAGAAAVLVSPGAAPADQARALSHAGVAGLVRSPGKATPAGPWWAATVEEIEGAGGPFAGGPLGIDVVYPPAPLAPAVAHPWVPAPGLGPVAGGPLVHAWAPGTAGGRYAARRALAGDPVATLAAFDPNRLGALIARRRPRACGLTPALAAALAASGAAERHDVSSVTSVVLSGTPSAGLGAALRGMFAGAAISELTPAPSSTVAAGPVAVSQEGMVWHEQFVPGSFNLPCLVRRYRGPLDVDALRWALVELARRHQPLRTTFAVAGGQPVQVVGDAGAFRVEWDDLADLTSDERDRRVADLLADASARPFDLVLGPLFEPRVLRLGPEDHLLVVRLHHTSFDDWSVDVFRRELSALYAARVAGAPSPLVEPPSGFADICRRRRADLAGDAGVALRAWWRKELDGAPLSVQLPLAGDGATGGPAEPLRLDLPPALAAGLRALAPKLRATPYMTVLAAFSVLLAGATGQDDLVISTVVAHRDRTELEALIGCFTKKVPVRLRVDGDPTFPELVARTRASLLGALAHQDLAFDAAVQEGLGAAAADHGVVPQVSVVFQAETPQRVRMAMPGLSIGPYEVAAESRSERHFSTGDEGRAWGAGIYLGSFLILSLLETPEGLSFLARGVFDRAACRRLLEDFQALLEDVVAAPERRVSELAVERVPAPLDDVLDVRGFRISRTGTEAALARCPGVDAVRLAVRDGRLVAQVESGAPVSLDDLRRALWAERPGALWPAALEGAAPAAAEEPSLLGAMWAEIAGRAVEPRHSYWQDFSFLQVVAEARAAGLITADAPVGRCRTLEMLAVASSS